MSETVANTGRKSTLSNAIYGVVTWVVPLCLSFIATPIIVGSLGHSDYGIYALILGFIGYSFSFSFGRAITKYVAEYRRSGESERIAAVVWTSLLLNLIVGTIGVVVIFLLAPWLVRDVFLIEPDAQAKSIIAFYIAAITIFATTINQLSSSALLGLHRFDIYSKVYTASGLFTIGGNLVLALYGFGLNTLLAWNLGVICVFALIYAVIAKRELPEFTARPVFNSVTFRMVLSYNAGVIGYQILANVLLLFERGWITNRLGTESLTYYVIPMSLGLQLQAFTSSFVQVLFPLASELSNDRERLLELYLKATKVIAIIVVFAVSIVGATAPQFLTLWVGSEIAGHSATLLQIHMAAFGIAAILSVPWQMTEGMGRTMVNFAIFAVCLVVSISLMLLFTSGYGNLGIAFARFAGLAVILLSIPVVEKMFFDKVQTAFWIKAIFGLGIAATAAVALGHLVITSFALSWALLLASFAASGIVYIAILFVVGFLTKTEFDIARKLVKR